MSKIRHWQISRIPYAQRACSFHGSIVYRVTTILPFQLAREELYGLQRAQSISQSAHSLQDTVASSALFGESATSCACGSVMNQLTETGIAARV